MFKSSHRLKMRAIRRWIIFFLCFFCISSYAQDLSTQATSVLLGQIKTLLKEDRPEELLPYLEETLVRMSDNEDKEAQKARSFCMYQIGVCQMQIGQYANAAKSFETFIAEYPSASSAPQASLLIAEAYAMGGDWVAVEKYAQTLMDKSGLDPERQMTAHQLLAEALYHQQKWQETTVPLLEIFNFAEDEKVRARAAVMLATCFAKLNDMEKLTEFLPHCSGLIHQSGTLNLALIEVADRKGNEGDVQNALFLYRKVLMKDELIARYTKRIAEMEVILAKPFVGGGGAHAQCVRQSPPRHADGTRQYAGEPQTDSRGVRL